MATPENNLEYTKLPGKFNYGTISNLVTDYENQQLLDIIEKFCAPLEKSIKTGLFFRNKDGYVAANKWLHLDGLLQERWNDIRLSIIRRLNSTIILEHYPVLQREDETNMEWLLGLTINSGEPLLPHNDDPIEARELVNNPDILVTSGVYKGVIYLGYPNIDYTGYGTRFYERISDKDYKEITETPFIPGSACIFQADSHSYHGTEYPTFNHPRYTITMEYF